VRNLKLTSFRVTLAGVEAGSKQVLIVEDWAEIRRRRTSERVSISGVRLFPVRAGNTAALQIGARSVCRLAAVDQSAGRGAPSVGVGRGGSAGGELAGSS
jgi:hypothetical protein